MERTRIRALSTHRPAAVSRHPFGSLAHADAHLVRAGAGIVVWAGHDLQVKLALALRHALVAVADREGLARLADAAQEGAGVDDAAAFLLGLGPRKAARGEDGGVAIVALGSAHIRAR